MRRLILLRHAETEADSESGRDLDRRLTASGREDAARVGRWLAASGFVPERVVSSPAARAVETARLAAGAMGLDPRDVALDDALYGADAPTLLALADAHARGGVTLLVSHNPGIGALVPALTATAEAPYPPGTASVVDLPADADTSDLRGRAALVSRKEPRELPAG